MSAINTDLSIPREWFARKGFNNQFTITFTNSGAFNISSYTFTLNIRRIGLDANIIQLTQSDGLTNGGASGLLTVNLSSAKTLPDSIPAQQYFFEINYTVGGLSYGLIHGTLNLLNQYNDENINESVTFPVNLSGTEITLAINLAGGSGSGGGITSVNGDTGPVVVLDAAEVGADPTGSAAAALATAQTYADGKVNNSITDGVTTVAPSQNAVFDALALKQNSLGYTAENQANKENTTLDTSTTKYPTNRLVKEYVDSQSGGSDAIVYAIALG